MIEASIVIPVYNKWELTRNCLQSIASRTPLPKVEVIVVDNASSDETPAACEDLGRRLFGQNFRYERNAVNRNFAGASNQGVELARGEHVIFLNNDTEVLRNWYEPLIQDFAAFPDIAATGPLLVYPDVTPLGRSVQHLGVCIMPSYMFAHLYRGIPAASPLARKRRFFQAITAACLVIKKNVFLDAGKFDEGFVNGWEDVDLCARLWEKGLRMTVNPASQVIHYESQTPGRNVHETANSKRLVEKSLFKLGPDWHFHIKQDGFQLNIDDWAACENVMSQEALRKLQPALAKSDLREILKFIAANPYWQPGWQKAFELTADAKAKTALFQIYFQLFPTPESGVMAYELGRQSGNKALVEQGIARMRAFADTPESYLHIAKRAAQWCRDIGMTNISAKYDVWIAAYDNFKNNTFAPFAQRYLAIERELRHQPPKIV